MEYIRRIVTVWQGHAPAEDEVCMVVHLRITNTICAYKIYLYIQTLRVQYVTCYISVLFDLVQSLPSCGFLGSSGGK